MGPLATQLLKILGISAGSAAVGKLTNAMSQQGVEVEDMLKVLQDPKLSATPLGERVGKVVEAVFGPRAGEFVSDVLTGKSVENERDILRKGVSPFIPDSAKDPSPYANYYFGSSNQLPTREMVSEATANVAANFNEELKVGLYEQIFANVCGSNPDQYLLLISFIKAVAAPGGYADAIAYEQILARRSRMHGFTKPAVPREVRAELASMRRLFAVVR